MKRLLTIFLLLCVVGAPAQADDLVKVAIGQRGNWDTAVMHLGEKAGIREVRQFGRERYEVVGLQRDAADGDPERPALHGNDIDGSPCRMHLIGAW